tara:strand:- start:146 stop:1165 length:1020 start_codon:yes stop_codon:yes gene_type:complete
MPIHLIWGEDTTAIEKHINSLIEKILDPNWSTVNFSRLDGDDNAQTIRALEEVQTAPFGSGGRLVLLRRSNLLNTCPIDLSIKFENIIEIIPNNTHLLLINKNKPDNRLKTTKILREQINKKKAFESNFSLPTIWDQKGQRELVKRIAEELSIDIEPKAIILITEALGNDSERISKELQKLSLYEESKISNNSRKSILIREESVKFIIDDIHTNSLKVGELLIKNKMNDAFYLLETILDQGEAPLRIIATLSGQIRLCLWVKILEKDSDKDASEIAKLVGIGNPKRIYVIRKQVQDSSVKILKDLLCKLLEIEIALKRGQSPKEAFKYGLLINEFTMSL